MNIVIVTVVYNDYVNLTRTFQSIRINKKKNQKYIVVDGNSTDGCKDLIINNLDIIDSYISEKDQGIYDAMNKILRFKVEDNDFILWLNAGDELLNWDNINFDQVKNYNAIFFSVIRKFNLLDVGSLVAPKIYLPYNVKNFFPKSMFMHQGFLIKYSYFKMNYYDINIGLQAENLLMSRAIIDGNYLVLVDPISVYYAGGISGTAYKKLLQSYIGVSKKLGFSFIGLIFFQRKNIFNLMIKSILPLGIVRKIQSLLNKNIN